LLLGANVFVLALPGLGLLGLRIYENYLVRQTERQLIGQSVVIGELYREAWLEERGPRSGEAPPFRPPGREADAFIPIEPVIDLRNGVLGPQPPLTRRAQPTDSPAVRAGRRLDDVLRRAQVFSLSGARVLDERGCVVATSRGEDGQCLDGLPEVDGALAGRYSAIARQRISDEPLPPLSDVRSRGSVRIFTALPIFSAGRVIGVVRMSRTSLDALTSLWSNRRGLLWLIGACLAGMAVISVGFAAWVARPTRQLTRAALAIAGARAPLPGAPPLLPARWAPAEIRALGAALATMTARLEARAAYVASFAADVSHELKSPLTAIRGAIELLREQGGSMAEAQRARFLDNIDADARRMERLVTRLLHLARIEHAHEALAEVPVRELLRERAAPHGPRVRQHLDRAPERVTIDPEHLDTAVGNLIENALRHGGDGPIDVTVESEAGRLIVSVRDHGPGISPGNQARLFERFFTTARDHGGTGLGLAITRAIAERRGGDVTFATGPTGTTFVLRV
jgi:signal transduction histidine kinase